MTQIKTIMKTIEVPQYQVGDKTFGTLEEAQREQRRLRELADPVLRYEGHYSYRKIMDVLGSVDAVGTFIIKDEGPVDYVSSGSARILKIVHGTFRNAIIEAFNTKGFVGWGPGKIELVEAVEV